MISERTTAPFIPEFSEAAERSKWIVENAEYFTLIRRQNRRYERTEWHTLDGAIKAGQRVVERDQTARFLVYGVVGIYDTLAATITSDGTKIIT